MPIKKILRANPLPRVSSVADVSQVLTDIAALNDVAANDVRDAILDDATKFHGASIAAILADTNQNKFEWYDWWGEPIASFAVTSAAGDHTLNDVTLTSLPGGGKTIARAYSIMRISGLRNGSAADNQLNLASVIQANRAGAGWITAIHIPANSIEVTALTRHPGGIVFVGDENISARVSFGSSTNFRWYQARATTSEIVFHGVQMGLRVMMY